MMSLRVRMEFGERQGDAARKWSRGDDDGREVAS